MPPCAASRKCTYGSSSGLPLTYTFLFRSSIVSPGRPITRLMKSRSGSSGYLKTTMSPRRMSRTGSSARSSADRRRAEDELVDQQVIADQQVVLHRPGRDLERLHHPGPHEQREDHRDDDRLEVFADGGFLESGHCRASGVSDSRSSRPSAPRGTLPAGSRRGRRASSASCLPSASRAACACG